ncbi:VOC family protein [Nocardioides aurantiacus]|uniref:VOC domain-containing protein n=1 Tax=Nocardioides aurantiacus TaxID=86796 RepID=A0A3N2CTT9_9ACTN|nr:VOC family protein [Nocardioides aurantiacus]ROR90866.1 hypothetical protein EDD33_1715 [Nocardioides aurantiacus]
MPSEGSFAQTRDFFSTLLETPPSWEADGFVAFHAPDGSSLELLASRFVPEYGLNQGVAFGFLVDDLAGASSDVQNAGGTLVGEPVRTDDLHYRHFRGPDGRTYGLVQRLTAD